MRRGLFLAILAMAAGELQALGRVLADCDSNLQGCDVDEGRVELKGLDLLQMQVRLQSDLAQSVPAAAQPDAQPEVIKPLTLAKAVDHTSDAQTVDSPAQPKSSDHTLDAQTVDSQSQAKSSGETAAAQSLHEHAHLVAALVSGNSSKILGIGVVFIILTLCICLVHSRRSLQLSLQEVDEKQIRPSSSAQQLLQAPSRSVGPFPIVASRNSSFQGSSRGSSLAASPANGGVGPASLPPICPSLILPHTEARFMIPISSLMTAAGELNMQIEQFDILGTSGRKLLHGTVTETPEGRRALAIASYGCDDDPRVTLLAPPRLDQQSGPLGSVCRIMELYGKSGKFYGTLEPASPAGALLRCNGELVMSLELGSSDLRMSVASMDGRLVASADKNVAQAGSMRQLESNDMWMLQVKPNFDAVLISACMLGVLMFK